MIIMTTKYTYLHTLFSFCWTLNQKKKKKKLCPIIVMIMRGMKITWNFIARALTREESANK